MSTRHLCERLAAWIHTHRPLRWVETIVPDFADWSPW